MSKLIYTADDHATASQIGGKAATLGRLTRAGLPVPAWFAISPAVQNGDQTSSRAEISRALDALPGEGLVAVRSSAVDEDGTEHSFAGQLESFLFVPDELVFDRVGRVIDSGFTERAAAYRREHGLGPPTPPAVLVQRMIDADVSGVAFAADPVSGSRRTAVISAVFGLGTALVGGDAEADTYRVPHNGQAVDRRVVRKSICHRMDRSTRTGGTDSITLRDDEADRPALTDEQARRVADLTLHVSRLEKRPQDIEWAIKDERLYLLQSRPITSLSAVADPEGVRLIWDNANIAESYNGVTTPLTFSFARRAYEGAYRQFCRLMKVPSRVVADNDAMFGQMLGLVQGRIYYNLLNWYRLLAMLPGYSTNGRFMEQMMGVREGLPPDVTAAVAARTWPQRQADRFRLAWSAAGLVWNHLVLPRKIRKFYARLNDTLAPPAVPLADMRLDQLAAEFRRLEGRLLSRWDAPLINDFLTMIFFGLLGKTTSKWIDAGGQLHNDLIGQEGGIISTEPVRRIADMAAIASDDVALVDLLCDGPADEAERRLKAVPTLAAAYSAYLERFGDRCLEELKLESPTLTDDPTPLLRTIGHTARRQAEPSGPARPFRPREAAEAKVRHAIGHTPVRAAVYRWLLRNTRARVRDRENLRFERTRLFGRVRRVMIEIGRRLVAEGLLADERDVFYLTLDEVLAYVEGTSCDTDLLAATRRRKEAFDEFRAGPPPADRFETHGAVYLGNRFSSPAGTATATTTGGDTLQGIGCCPGIVRGPVRVIRQPRGASLRPGEILVAERTDPGWVLLFPAAAGVLVERGSLLSHSAIVARELGIPAVVSVPGLLAVLNDGDEVEFDGSLGTIRRLSKGDVS